MEIIDQVDTFIHSKEFWPWHGFVLSGLWVFASAAGLLAKRFSTKLHVLIFIFINFTTIFFAGAALYRLYPKLESFLEWDIMKQGHVAGGAIFLLLVILQHVGGASAYFGNKANPQHRDFGAPLVMIGRTVAGFGWILGGNLQNAIIVGVISVVFLIGSFLLPKGPSAASTTSTSSRNSRSKSPKRQ